MDKGEFRSNIESCIGHLEQALDHLDDNEYDDVLSCLEASVSYLSDAVQPLKGGSHDEVVSV